jgi:hypothetical protein
MVVVTLSRTSVLRVCLGDGGTDISSGSHTHPSHSCDGWVCDLGVVDVSSIFGLVRGTGDFTVVFPTFVLVSRMQLAQQYRDNVHFLNSVSSSRHETMVVGTLPRGWALCIGLGVGGSTIVSGSCVRPSHSRISRLFSEVGLLKSPTRKVYFPTIMYFSGRYLGHQSEESTVRRKFVYDESMKRELKKKLIYDCRSIRLTTLGCLLVVHYGTIKRELNKRLIYLLLGGLEHLFIYYETIE